MYNLDAKLLVKRFCFLSRNRFLVLFAECYLLFGIMELSSGNLLPLNASHLNGQLCIVCCSPLLLLIHTGDQF